MGLVLSIETSSSSDIFDKLRASTPDIRLHPLLNSLEVALCIIIILAEQDIDQITASTQLETCTLPHKICKSFLL